MDDGLVLGHSKLIGREKSVLILIVVDDGLVQAINVELRIQNVSLNPYCSGRWSRTAQ